MHVQVTNTDDESNVITATLAAILWRNDQLGPDFKELQIMPLALIVRLHSYLF